MPPIHRQKPQYEFFGNKSLRAQKVDRAFDRREAGIGLRYLDPCSDSVRSRSMRRWEQSADKKNDRKGKTGMEHLRVMLIWCYHVSKASLLLSYLFRAVKKAKKVQDRSRHRTSAYGIVKSHGAVLLSCSLWIGPEPAATFALRKSQGHEIGPWQQQGPV